jgi:Domain of unknown function (DUF4145)
MYNWTCPYCDRDQTVTAQRMDSSSSVMDVGTASEGRLALTGIYISCANPRCHRTTVEVAIRPTKWVGGTNKADFDQPALFERRIKPDGSARPQHECIPKALMLDYEEACLIRDLSPKASATLVRRCLQGMIRDFAQISDRTLFLEIGRLRKAVADGIAPQGVTNESVDAIDHVRKVGNIGAHMEADINHIVDVDPGEAAALISLVEMLFEEWYIARHRRQERLAQIAAIAVTKDGAKMDAVDPEA